MDFDSSVCIMLLSSPSSSRLLSGLIWFVDETRPLAVFGLELVEYGVARCRSRVSVSSPRAPRSAASARIRAMRIALGRVQVKLAAEGGCKGFEECAGALALGFTLLDAFCCSSCSSSSISAAMPLYACVKAPVDAALRPLAKSG